MTIIEIQADADAISQRQRYSHYFAIAFCLIGLVIGLNLRDSNLYATSVFTDAQAGVRAFYPENWLIDTANSDYIFRVRDMSQTGFKTTIQVSMMTVSAQTSLRNVTDALTFSRSQAVSEYRFFSIEPYSLNELEDAELLSYAYADSESGAFLETLPAVVRGVDVITIRGGQTIIITFLSDETTFERNYPQFERFLAGLEL